MRRRKTRKLERDVDLLLWKQGGSFLNDDKTIDNIILLCIVIHSTTSRWQLT